MYRMLGEKGIPFGQQLEISKYIGQIVFNKNTIINILKRTLKFKTNSGC